MKKIILWAAAFCLCPAAIHAQFDTESMATATTGETYSVGDIYVKDGLNTVVLSVDASGQHGIAMLLPEAIDRIAYYSPFIFRGTIMKKKWTEEEKERFKTERQEVGSKKNKESIAKNAKFFSDWVEENSIVQSKSQSEHREKIYSQMGEDGKQNMAVVERYCADNGVDMKEAFPEFAYAKSLGEGWFIPGNREAEYYADYIGFGLGREKNVIVDIPKMMKVKGSLKATFDYQESFYNNDFFVKHRNVEEELNAHLDIADAKKVYLPFGIFSSSMVEGKNSFYFSMVDLVCDRVRKVKIGPVATPSKDKDVYYPSGTLRLLPKQYVYWVEGISLRMYSLSSKTAVNGKDIYYYDTVSLNKNISSADMYMMVRPFCEF